MANFVNHGMTSYIIKRLLYFIPTLFIISILAYLISVIAPGDPVDRAVQGYTGAGNKTLSEERLRQKKIWRTKLGLDLPLFYFSIHSLAEPDTLYKIYPPLEKNTLKRLISSYGNWPEITAYYESLNMLEADLIKLVLFANGAKIPYEKISELRFACLALKGIYDSNLITIKIREVNEVIAADPQLAALHNSGLLMARRFGDMQAKATSYKNYIPVISLHPYNQYHRWLFGDGNWLTGKAPVFTKGILRGDFGTSYVTGLPVMQELLPRIKWSMILAFLAILLAMAISIPIGLRSAAYENGLFDRISGGILFFFFSMPVFWVGTLLLLLFANPNVLQLFPTSGIKPVTGYPADASLIQKIMLTAPFLVLPLFCYTYGATSYLSRSIRISVIGELTRDYIRTARAKGVSYPKIISRHAFANSKLPLITLLANVLPQAVSGSLIIETIFTIPGMGFETINSFQHQNYPVIVAIFTITGLLTITGYFIADILYAVADPRISYKKEIH